MMFLTIPDMKFVGSSKGMYWLLKTLLFYNIEQDRVFDTSFLTS